MAKVVQLKGSRGRQAAVPTQTLVTEVRKLLKPLTIDVTDRANIQPSGELAGKNTQVSITDFYHDHDSYVDLIVHLTDPKKQPICLPDHEIVLKRQGTRRAVARESLETGNVSFPHTPPNTRYTLELRKKRV